LSRTHRSDPRKQPALARLRTSLALCLGAASLSLVAPAHAEDVLDPALVDPASEASSAIAGALTDLTELELVLDPEEMLETEGAQQAEDSGEPVAAPEADVQADEGAVQGETTTREPASEPLEEGGQYQIAARQYHPANINVSVRVLSPGDNGLVSQQNAQRAPEAAQSDPANTNVSVRVLSPGNDGAVGQANGLVDALADAEPEAAPPAAPVTTDESDQGLTPAAGAPPAGTSEWTWVWNWNWDDRDIAPIDIGSLIADPPEQYHGNGQQYQPGDGSSSPSATPSAVAEAAQVQHGTNVADKPEQKFIWNWIWNWNWNRPPQAAFGASSPLADPQPSLPSPGLAEAPPGSPSTVLDEEPEAWDSWIWDELVAVDRLATNLISAVNEQTGVDWGLWFAGMPEELEDAVAPADDAVVSIAPPASAVSPGGISPARPKCSNPSCLPEAPGPLPRAKVAVTPAPPAVVERPEDGHDALTAAPAGPKPSTAKADPEGLLLSLPLQPTGSSTGSQGASASPPGLFFGGLVAVLAALLSLATPGLLRAVSVSSCVRRAKALVLPLERPG
jgi:hypothetical protein